MNTMLRLLRTKDQPPQVFALLFVISIESVVPLRSFAALPSRGVPL